MGERYKLRYPEVEVVTLGQVQVTIAPGAKGGDYVSIPRFTFDRLFESVLVPLPPSPLPAATASPTEFGSWWAGDEPSGTYATMAQAGCKWARVRAIYPSVSPDDGWWAWQKGLVSLAKAAGLRVLLEWWASPSIGDVSTGNQLDIMNAQLALLRNLPEVDAWQPVCNEPDMQWSVPYSTWPAFWSCATAIRAAGKKVVSPGLAWEPSQQGWNNQQFQRAIAEIGQNSRAVDGAAVHVYAPYSANWQGGMAGKVTAFRKSLASYAARSDLPIWVTEFGDTSLADPWHSGRNEQTQALGVAGAVAAMRTANVAVAFQYSAVDRPGQGWGLLRPDRSEKAAMAAFRRAVLG